MTIKTSFQLATPASSAGAPAGAPSSEALSDEAVVERVLAGDVAAFELLMRRNNPRLFRAVRAIVRSDQEAEDVMQDAYVRAFEHLGGYQKRASFATWLIRIAVNEALARGRRSKRMSPLEETDEVLAMPATTATPEQRTSDRELRQLLQAAIDELSEEFRVVFVLRAIEQMSVAEISQCLELREETVKTRFFRARQRLRHALLNRFDASAASVFEFHLTRCNRVVAGVFERIRNRSA